MKSVTNDSTPQLQLSQVSIMYGNLPIIDTTDWSVFPGELIGLFGGNGAGKSTLMRAILGLVEYRGTISYLGAKLDSKLRARHMAYVPQFFAVDRLFPLTVREVLDLEVWASGGKLGDRKFAAQLQLLMVDEILDMQLNELSGGQLQRVLITRALLSEPNLIILDEPTNSLDRASIATFDTVLGKLHQQGVTLIIVTHNHEYLHTLHTHGSLYEVIDGKVVPHVH